MKKAIFSSFFIGILGLGLHAQEERGTKIGTLKNPALLEKNQIMSKSTSSWKPKKVTTNTVTYEVTDYGVHCHVGWYSDGCICTSLDGTRTGIQFITVNGVIVDSSTNFKVTGKNDFVHTYSWGKVYSYKGSQKIAPN